MNQVQYIPDIFNALTAKVATQLGQSVRFDFGHYGDVCQNIKFKDESITMKADKYPLIWLVMDFEERRGRNPADYADLSSAMIIIAVDTQPTYTMQERRDISYLPVLYPIYDSLLTQISKSRAFGMPSKLNIVHTKIDRPYWNGGEPGGKNMFNDYIDAIQIKGLSLSVKQNCIIS